MFHRVPSSQFDRFQSTYKQSKTNHFCFLFSVVRYRFFFLFSLFYDRFGFPPETRKWKTARNSPRTAVKSNFSLHENTYTNNKKGRLTHTGKQKATSTKRKYFARAKQNGFIFFVLSFTIWESRNKRKFKENSMYMEKML